MQDCKLNSVCYNLIVIRFAADEPDNSKQKNKKERQHMTSEIYCTDAFRKVGEFKQQGLKVNHIITDPPYNISKKTISAA